MLDAATLQLTPPQADLLRRLLATHVPGVEVWAFGGRTNGRAHEGSDLDLALRRPGGSPVPVADADALREALQASTLPMLADVHDWALLPMAFREEIERHHRVVRAAGEAAVGVAVPPAHCPPML